MNVDVTIVDRAVAADAQAIGRLYAAAGYGAVPAATDIVLVARRCGQIVGVVRLCAEGGVLVLRGMQVRADMRRQGVGTALLSAGRPHLCGRSTFCLPYVHLVDFYAGAGFEVLNREALPDFLGERLATYRAHGQDVVAMRRPADSGLR